MQSERYAVSEAEHWMSPMKLDYSANTLSEVYILVERNPRGEHYTRPLTCSGSESKAQERPESHLNLAHRKMP